MSDQIGKQYPFFQLAKALAAANPAQADKWRNVLAGMQLGDILIGSRTPVVDMPVWATPEIMRGGFATGAFAAGGPLQPHEEELADRLSLADRDTQRTRAALNAWHLGDAGLAHLHEMARSGRFDAQTPEETALLAIALLSQDHPENCDHILNAITPYFDRLRFFPAPAQYPVGNAVHVGNVGQLRKILKKLRPSDEILRQSASLSQWLPLYDRLVDLLAEPDDSGWPTRARAWMSQYDTADRRDMSRRWSDQDRPFQRCRRALEQRLSQKGLTAGQQRYVDLVIARRARKYGTGADRDLYREIQTEQEVELRFDALAKVMLQRVKDLPDSGGIGDIDQLIAPIAGAEARPGARAGASLPGSVVRKAMSARIAPIAELVQDGQITSPEVLASLLPQITADLHASGFADPAARNVFAALYRAFRRRRSVLLVDLQSQIGIDELPWASALLDIRQTSADDTAISAEALREIVTLCLTHFPQVQLPNPLVEELLRLAQRAGLDIPLTRELAADIFMGEFSKPFEKAACIALQRYRGTPYASYYTLPDQIVEGQLGRICAQRAGQNGRSWFAATNGKIIEQQLILTTHGLAPLFARLDLPGLDFAAMAQHCFGWICNRLGACYPHRYAELVMLKKMAYAWRQMILFLSELPKAERSAAMDMIEGIFAQQPYELRQRFHAAIVGLRQAMAGHGPDTAGGRIFLGWTHGQHPFASASGK